MTPSQIGEHLRLIIRGMNVESDPLGPAKTFTISFTEQYDLIHALRIYQNGEQILGIETAEWSKPGPDKKRKGRKP